MKMCFRSPCRASSFAEWEVSITILSRVVPRIPVVVFNTPIVVGGRGRQGAVRGASPSSRPPIAPAYRQVRCLHSTTRGHFLPSNFGVFRHLRGHCTAQWRVALTTPRRG